MTHHVRADVVIFGGGIAGLWSLNVLRNAGVNAVLVESQSLGGIQTLASQGMIHGGQRYALQGKANEHSDLLKQVPELWNKCFHGNGLLNLSNVELLAQVQHMWSPGSLTATVAAFFASKVMQSEVEKLPRTAWPAGLDLNCGRTGAVYQLNEVVVNSLSLVTELAAPHAEWLIKGQVREFMREGEEIFGVVLTTTAGSVEIVADGFVAAAGAGNEQIRDMLGMPAVKTQRRPLKQIMVRPAPYELFAHCITTDPRPRATITTHQDSSGGAVWYMGGLVGVYGVDKSDDEALTFAQKEMASLFPKVDWSTREWAVLPVDRAEPKVESGFLPDGPQVTAVRNVLYVWPTKMTFAPVLGVKVREWAATLARTGNESAQAFSLPRPDAGQNPWDTITWQQ